MIRTIISLEPGGDKFRARVLAEVTIINLNGAGRISSDYAWRIISVDRDAEQTVVHGCLVDSRNRDAIDLLWEVLAEWKSGRQMPIDNHGNSVRLIHDHEAYWKDVDTEL